MASTAVLTPDDVDVESLRRLYDGAGLETKIDSDGDLAVSSGVTCYAIPTEQRDRILLLAFVGTKDEASYAEKIEFSNRVNNSVSTLRARVNEKGGVLFDYHIPVEGGITAAAIVLVTRFFLHATAHAAREHDDDDIVR